MADAEIYISTPEELLREFLEYNGLIGWASTIIDALDELREARITESS